MIKRRLLILANHLEKLAATDAAKRKRYFKMNTWIHKSSCGTTACAMGEACFIPEFKKLGLKAVKEGNDAFMQPTFKNETGFNAAALFFGINVGIARLLFDPASYWVVYKQDDPAAVAAKIRRLLAGKSIL